MFHENWFFSKAIFSSFLSFVNTHGKSDWRLCWVCKKVLPTHSSYVVVCVNFYLATIFKCIDFFFISASMMNSHARFFIYSRLLIHHFNFLFSLLTLTLTTWGRLWGMWCHLKIINWNLVRNFWGEIFFSLWNFKKEIKNKIQKKVKICENSQILNCFSFRQFSSLTIRRRNWFQQKQKSNLLKQIQIKKILKE